MNPKFYPESYPEAASDQGAVSDLESAIKSVALQSVRSALQSTHTRRYGGQNSIQVQNAVIGAFSKPLPNSWVGPVQVIRPDFGGSLAHIVNLENSESSSFSLETESLLASGLRLTEQRFYGGSLHSQSSGIIAGGRGAGGLVASMDSLSFTFPSVRRISATLDTPLFGMAGVGTKNTGYLMGGSVGTLSSTKKLQRYNHVEESSSYMGEILQAARTAPHDGLSSRTDGVLVGGCAMSAETQWFIGLNSIESINLSTGAVSQLGATTSHPHVSHAAFGNRLFGYLLGGGINQSQSHTDSISRFDHSAKTIASLGIRLSKAKICLNGFGSSRAGYAMAGHSSGGWSGSREIEKLEYLAVERIAVLGTQLSSPYADANTVYDYNS